MKKMVVFIILSCVSSARAEVKLPEFSLGGTDWSFQSLLQGFGTHNLGEGFSREELEGKWAWYFTVDVRTSSWCSIHVETQAADEENWLREAFVRARGGG